MDIAAQSRQLLGSVIEIKLPEQHSNLFPDCFEEIKRIENTYSRFLENSKLSQINKNLNEWQDVSDEFIFLLSKANEIKEKTKGNFDITLKEVLDSMGYDKDYSFKPKTNLERIENSEARSDDILIDFKNTRIMLRKQIEFGGFGKGYALDKVRELLEKKGVMHYYINAGGDIFARKSDDCDPWVILLEHPDDPEMAIGKIYLDNKSIAGSAPNRRKWGNYHHLINAKTRKPATGVKAIFAIGNSGIEADAYATAVFTAGFNEGIELSRSLPIEVLIISSQNKMFQSSGFEVEFFV